MEHAFDAPSPWLPRTPPPLVFNIAGWMLVLLAFVIVALATLVSIPEVEVCAFSLEPEGGYIRVESEREGHQGRFVELTHAACPR